VRAALVGGTLGALLASPVPGWGAEALDACVSCHAEQEDSDLSTPVEEWRRSVHAEAEVSCDGCHGGNPYEDDEELSMDEGDAGFLGAPGWADVSEFCGACHEEILDAYRQSVMGTIIEKGVKAAVCTTCHMHGGHAIAHADPREILTEARCGVCHEATRAIVLRDLLEETGGRIEAARAGLDGISRIIDVSRLDREVKEIRQRAVVIAHTYDRERIAEFAGVAHARLDAVASETLELEGEAVFRRRMGFGVVGALLLTLVGVVGLTRGLEKRGTS
jgi:hypothetical protein